MWKAFNDYFHFSKKERKGIIILFSIVIIISILPKFYSFFLPEKKESGGQFQEELSRLQMDSAKKKNNFANKISYIDNRIALQNVMLPIPDDLMFDPNMASFNDWISLGVKERTAMTIRKYIEKGGGFKSPEDLNKIYGLSPDMVKRLIPHIKIANQKKMSSLVYPDTFRKEFNNVRSIPNIDINTADSFQLSLLPGIGYKLANRIITFREKLGGFYSINQVAETYLLPDSTFQNIKKFLMLENVQVYQYNLNTVTVDEIRKHPYIDYRLANAIVQYRKQHGSFKLLSDLKKIMIVSDSIYNKVSPYLIVQ